MIEVGVGDLFWLLFCAAGLCSAVSVGLVLTGYWFYNYKATKDYNDGFNAGWQNASSEDDEDERLFSMYDSGYDDGWAEAKEAYEDEEPREKVVRHEIEWTEEETRPAPSTKKGGKK